MSINGHDNQNGSEDANGFGHQSVNGSGNGFNRSNRPDLVDDERPLGVVEPALAYQLFTLLLGLGMLYELIGGKYPKFNENWTSGDRLTELSQGVLDGVTWEWVAVGLREVVIPNATFLSGVVLVLQAGVALSLLTGVLVRCVSLLAIPMFVGMNVAVQTLRTPQWYITGLVVVIILHPYFVYGIDRRLLSHLNENPSAWGRRARALINFTFEGWFMGRRFSVVFGALTAIATASLMYQVSLDDKVLRLTMLEVTVFVGLLAATMYLYRTRSVGSSGVATTLARLAVGKAALWPILSNTSVKVTALPGFADGDKMQAVLTDTVGATHWGPLAALATDVLAPNVTALAVFAGIVQVTIGVCLILGYQLRSVRWIAVAYFALACLIGFTRTTQYALLFSLALVFLGSGWELSLDRLLAKPRPTTVLPNPVIVMLAVVAALSAIVLAQGTITADPYTSNVATAVFSALGLSAVPLTAFFGAQLALRSSAGEAELVADSGVTDDDLEVIVLGNDILDPANA